MKNTSQGKKLFIIIIYAVAFFMISLWLIQAKRQTDLERQEMNNRLQKIADDWK